MPHEFRNSGRVKITKGPHKDLEGDIQTLESVNGRWLNTIKLDDDSIVTVDVRLVEDV